MSDRHSGLPRLDGPRRGSTSPARPSEPPAASASSGKAAIVPTLFVLLGVAASVLPLRDLFDGLPWGPSLITVLGVVGVAGVVTRWARAPRPVVPLVQAVALTALLTAMFGNGTGAFGVLPTPSTGRVVGLLLADALDSIASAAPAPSTQGVVFTVAATAGVVAIVTDAVGVTWSKPALAGLPMVVPFLISVANSTQGLPIRFVVLLGACWLGLLAVSDDDRITGWVRTASGRSGVDSGARTVRIVSAATTGAVALSASLLVAALLPIAPTTDLSGRLGLSGGAGRVGFSPSPDMLSDLDDRNPTSVLLYRSDDPSAPPLRVAVSTAYLDGAWQERGVRDRPSSSPLLARPPGLTDDVARLHRNFQVIDNRLAAPNLAAPALVTHGTVVGATWGMDPETGVLVAGAMPSRYDLGYLQLRPTTAQLRSAQTGANVVDTADPVLDLSGVSPETIRIANEVTASARTPYDKAVALQNWFRSTGGFEYSLELEPPPAQMSEAEAALTSVDRFLVSKRGYCVQFSTAMTLMARSLDIPARLATGFLPGRVEGDGRRVLSTDAHAWPELYFEGIGWLRFEPTPSIQSGPAPDYAPDTADEPAAPTAQSTPTPTPTPTAEATPTPTASAPEDQSAVPAARSGMPWLPLLIGVLACAVVALTVGLLSAPARIAARHRRDRLQAVETPQDGVIAVWDGLLEQLADLGLQVDPARALPSQADELASATELDEDGRSRLTRLAADVENALYAPVGAGTRVDDAARAAPGPDAASHPAVLRCLADANAVLDCAYASRSRAERTMAKAFPASGRASLARRIQDRVNALTRR